MNSNGGNVRTMLHNGDGRQSQSLLPTLPPRTNSSSSRRRRRKSSTTESSPSSVLTLLASVILLLASAPFESSCAASWLNSSQQLLKSQQKQQMARQLYAARHRPLLVGSTNRKNNNIANPLPVQPQFRASSMKGQEQQQHLEGQEMESFPYEAVRKPVRPNRLRDGTTNNNNSEEDEEGTPLASSLENRVYTPVRPQYYHYLNGVTDPLQKQPQDEEMQLVLIPKGMVLPENAIPVVDHVEENSMQSSSSGIGFPLIMPHHGMPVSTELLQQKEDGQSKSEQLMVDSDSSSATGGMSVPLIQPPPNLGLSSVGIVPQQQTPLSNTFPIHQLSLHDVETKISSTLNNLSQGDGDNEWTFGFNTLPPTQARDHAIILSTVASMALLVGAISARKLRNSSSNGAKTKYYKGLKRRRRFLWGCLEGNIHDDMEYDAAITTIGSTLGYGTMGSSGSSSLGGTTSGIMGGGNGAFLAISNADGFSTVSNNHDYLLNGGVRGVGGLVERRGYGWRGDLEKFDV